MFTIDIFFSINTFSQIKHYYAYSVAVVKNYDNANNLKFQSVAQEFVLDYDRSTITLSGQINSTYRINHADITTKPNFMMNLYVDEGCIIFSSATIQNSPFTKIFIVTDSGVTLVFKINPAY